jgi:GNAT superfamily N-acetyltransferase
MPFTYYKRFRMEINLERRNPVPGALVRGYRLVPWHSDLVQVHAETKYRSFRWEIDADVFPCLGDLAGCARLMDEISHKDGFLPEATWLLEYVGSGPRQREYCGTVQGIRADGLYGGIQNLGVTPRHRGRGLGMQLMDQALRGFRRAGLTRAYLEVTARNTPAVRMYERMGFSRARTLYKAVEAACV